MKTAVFSSIALLILMLGFSVPASVVTASGIPQGKKAITVDLFDYAFKPSSLIQEKELDLHFVNRGTRSHEVVLIRLEEGATVKTYLETNAKGVPTRDLGRPVKNIPPMKSGDKGTLSINLEPGHYMLGCFVADKEQASPTSFSEWPTDFRLTEALLIGVTSLLKPSLA